MTDKPKPDYPATLELAMLAIQGEITNPIKTATNPHFKNKYATLPEICDLYRPLLAKYGCYMTHNKGLATEGSEVLITKIVHAPTGLSMESLSMLHLEKNTPQGVGSAMTYLRRYDAQALLGVAQDDDDGQGAEKPKSNAIKNDPTVKQDMKELGYDPDKVADDMIGLIQSASDVSSLKKVKIDNVRHINTLPDDHKAAVIGEYNSALATLKNLEGIA